MNARMLTLMVLGLGCAPPASSLDGGQFETVQVDGTELPPGWIAPTGPCTLDPVAPRRLVLTTTDFATGAITVVDLANETIDADVAEGSTDAIPFAHGSQLVVVHRHQLDRIDVLETDGWRLAAQHALEGEAVSVNPHGLAFDADGLAYVTTFAEPWLRVLDLAQPPAQAERGRIDLSGFADADGNPEASLVVACGDTVVVGDRKTHV